MRADLTLLTPAGRAVDLRVRAHAGASLGDVEDQLRAACGVASDAPLWTPHSRARASASLGAVGLRDGCQLTVGPPTHRPAPATNALRLSVVGGPDAGHTVALRTGTTTIGRAPDCDLQLADPDVSRHHLELSASGSGVRAADAGSRNGSILEGADLSTAAPVEPGQVLRIGDSLIAVGGAHDPPAPLRPAPDGSVRVLTSAVPVPAVDPVEITLPGDEVPALSQRVPWIAAVLPLITGVLFAVVMRSVQFLLFSLLSPLTMLGTALSDRLTTGRKRRRRRGEQRARAAESNAAIARRLRTETVLCRHRDPDPAAIGAIARTPTARLWERSYRPADLLRVRVGCADLPSAVTVRRGQLVQPAGTLWCVPVAVDLADGPLGITAPLPVARALARWVIAQLVTLGPPSQLHLAAFLGADPAPWRWLRWVPHLRAGLGVTPTTRQDLIKNLGELITGREAERDPSRGPRIVVVVDADSDDAAALTPLLARGAAVGVSAVWVGHPSAGVAPVCGHIVRAAGETGSRVTVVRTQAGQRTSEPITAVADQVNVGWADGLARALAPLRDGADVGDTAAGTTLLRTPGMELDAIEQRWQEADARPRTMLGTNGSGPVWVDLVRDGPHALVAGTTGSGKSELLRTLVAGLALRLPPESLSFLLVDYKGGAAFAECARLPHVTGVVTDLDPRLTMRALRSLECELRRRERLFAAVAANDIDGYRARPGGQAVARLVIVVDEFAALAADLPEFVDGLVAVAQRGRSLGVHLVLATQRPGACVSPDIKANTALRIVLRVADPAESFDLIGRPDAARIAKTSPGRALVASGDRGEDVQVSHVGGRTAGEAHRPTVELLDEWRRVVGAGDEDVPTGPTDLSRIVDSVTAAADRRPGAPVPAPWLPPLAESIPLHSLPIDPISTRVAFGVADRPDLQDQPPEALDLGPGGAVLLAGAPRSGRSTGLRAIAFAAARRLAPGDLHVYLIDCAGGALSELARLPHCVTATTATDWDVVAELICRLERSIPSRRRPAETAATDTAALAGPAGVPVQLLLIDGWDEFVAMSAERDHGRTADAAARLVAAAGSAATTVVLSGGRPALTSRAASAIALKYVLRLADRADYALAGISPRDVPVSMPPGRALRAPDGVEVQIADVDDAPVRTQPSRRQEDGISLRPLPIAVRVADMPTPAGLLRIGLTGAGEAAGVPSETTGGLLVAGPPGSGRTSALRVLLREARRLGVPTVVAAQPGSPLYRDAGAHGVPVLDPMAPLAAAHFATTKLILVDDADAFAATTVDDAACAVLGSRGAHLVVAGADTHSLSRAYRGLVPALLRSRRALLLQPSPSDGDLVAMRLPPGPAHDRIPGRGVLIGGVTSSAQGPSEAECSWVQVPQPEEPDAPGHQDQPMCGYR